MEIPTHMFKHPFTCMVFGPSGSGKSELIFKILKYNQSLIQPAPQKIIYCYSIWSDKFNKLHDVYPSIQFQEGIPSVDNFNSNLNNLLILDDLMTKAKSESMLELFTVHSHHLNISVFLLAQNVFCQSKNFRTMSINTHYFILLNNPRDKSQINCLSRQMYPKNVKFLEECYEDAVSEPFGYLFIDFKTDTSPILRVQSNILENRIIYKPKD
jgi:hypothetical protein